MLAIRLSPSPILHDSSGGQPQKSYGAAVLCDTKVLLSRPPAAQ